jgi:hypothetical protein
VEGVVFVLWLNHSKKSEDKFKADNIDRYDGSSNPKEFIQVY